MIRISNSRIVAVSSCVLIVLYVFLKYFENYPVSVLIFSGNMLVSASALLLPYTRKMSSCSLWILAVLGVVDGMLLVYSLTTVLTRILWPLKDVSDNLSFLIGIFLVSLLSGICLALIWALRCLFAETESKPLRIIHKKAISQV